MPKHIPWLDAARIIAIFGVILIHVTASVFGDSRSDFYTIQIANAFDSLARISVPLFAMISGSLLLNTETPLLSVKNKILKVAFPLVFWSIIYALYINNWSPLPFDFFKSIVSIFQSPIMYHLWFVYMIIGIYIILPLLHPIAEKLISNQKLSFYFFSLWFLINSLTIYFPFSLIKLMAIGDFMSWPGYFILGYYLAYTKQIPDISKTALLFVLLLAVLCTFGLTWYFNSNTNFIPLNEIAYNYFSPNVVIASVAAFLWLKQLTISNYFAKILSFLSTLVFPVYFMHLLIIAILTGGVLGFSIDQFFIHPIIGILLLTASTLVLSLLLALIAKKIPYLSKITG
jgi:surface polysaccharide O-acyltransferase-like enzyme